MSIYDATYSATCEILREAHIGHYVEQAYMRYTECVERIMEEHTRPSAIYKPKVYLDGDVWCALYGSNIQEGVCGFGGTPADAVGDFDKSWGAA